MGGVNERAAQHVAAARLTVRFLRRVPPALRRPTTRSEAHRLRAARLEARETAFLDKLRRTAFARPESPYGRLLEHAGCEAGDVERLVASEGLEGTLGELARRGIYLTVDEFKGRSPVRRGSLTFECGSAAVRNPLSSFDLAVRSGGTRSAGTPVLLDLDFIRGCGTVAAAFLEAWGDSGWPKAIWETPGAGARFRLLKYASFGQAPVRWFSQVDPEIATRDPGIRRSLRAMELAGRLGGVPIPRPEHVRSKIRCDRALDGSRDRGRRTPFPLHLHELGSSVVPGSCRGWDRPDRSHDHARRRADNGRSGSRRSAPRERRRSHATARSRPARSGTVPRPDGSRRHASSERPPGAHFILPRAQAASALPDKALLVTALLPTSPFLLLNTSMGDEGELFGARVDARSSSS